ncbi:MAG TPA: alpha/beta fold hydrolase [Chitinophaga sp.]|uniref:thioesterase II family protein n=1 Tax=Chitinophaga sp. TaxID=1869181 RepID=UPI002F933161
MKVNIFCLPFAGGSRYSYQGYEKYASPQVTIIPVDLPGRGSRFADPLLGNIYELADDVFQQLQDRLHEPYALYGHSMGALLSYLLTKRILQEGLPAPLHLFLTGRAAPSVVKQDAVIHTLPKAAFFEALAKLGGCPEELLRNEDLKDFFEPIIRSDLGALHTYQHEETTPFDIPMTVMTGLQENISFEDALAWQKESTELITVRKFTGDHFFIYDHEREIVQLMAGLLTGARKKQHTAVYA